MGRRRTRKRRPRIMRDAVALRAAGPLPAPAVPRKLQLRRPSQHDYRIYLSAIFVKSEPATSPSFLSAPPLRGSAVQGLRPRTTPGRTAARAHAGHAPRQTAMTTSLGKQAIVTGHLTQRRYGATPPGRGSTRLRHARPEHAARPGGRRRSRGPSAASAPRARDRRSRRGPDRPAAPAQQRPPAKPRR